MTCKVPLPGARTHPYSKACRNWQRAWHWSSPGPFPGPPCSQRRHSRLQVTPFQNSNKIHYSERAVWRYSHHPFLSQHFLQYCCNIFAVRKALRIPEKRLWPSPFWPPPRVFSHEFVQAKLIYRWTTALSQSECPDSRNGEFSTTTNLLSRWSTREHTGLLLPKHRRLSTGNNELDSHGVPDTLTITKKKRSAFKKPLVRQYLLKRRQNTFTGKRREQNAELSNLQDGFPFYLGLLRVHGCAF